MNTKELEDMDDDKLVLDLVQDDFTEHDIAFLKAAAASGMSYALLYMINNDPVVMGVASEKRDLVVVLPCSKIADIDAILDSRDKKA